MSYEPLLERLYGEKYKFGIPLLEDNTTFFNSILNATGITYKNTYNGSTYYTVYLIPTIDEEGSLEIYALESSSGGSRMLVGPYTISNVDETSIKVLDDFSNSQAPKTLTNTSKILNKLNTIQSFTLNGSAHYEDLSGKKITPSDLYLKYLPAIETYQRVDENGFETNLFNYIDTTSEYKHVILHNEYIGSNLGTMLYEVDSGSSPKKVEEYKDSYISRTWQNLTGFSYFTISTTQGVFNNRSYQDTTYLVQSDNSYFISAFNDSNAYTTISTLFSGLTCPYFISSSGPLSYYQDYSSLTLSFDDSQNSNIEGTLKARFLDNSEWFYYVYTFTISEINNTTISVA